MVQYAGMGILRDINIAASHFLLPQRTRDTYITIVEEAKKVVGAKHGSIILWKDNKLKRVYTSHRDLYKVIPRKKGRTYEAYILGDASFYHVRDIKEPHPILKRLGIKTVVYLPLSHEEETIGVINMLCEDYLDISPERLAVLKLFGTLASLAIKKSQLYMETKNSLDNQLLYLSLASHEIKTPLTALYTFVQLLDSGSEDLDPARRTLIKKIRAETVRINILIGEFLEGKNINLDPSAYNWRVLNLKEVIDRSMGNFTAVFPNHKIDFSNKDRLRKIPVRGDFDKLLQVFSNILNNSGKYSPENKKITVELKKNGKNITLSVKDSGKGIPEADIKHIFNKFYRSSNGMDKKGMGLGLYLVKSILTNHGGTVEVKSKEGKGAKFIIELPINKNGKE